MRVVLVLALAIFAGSSLAQSVGSAFQGSCYQSAEAAAGAQCTSAYPQTGSDALGPFSLACTGSTATTLSLVRSRTDASTEAMSLPVSYATCLATDIGTAVITPELALQAFSWGFLGILTCYMVAWGCAQILGVIKGH
jgi:hypothetical protein